MTKDIVKQQIGILLFECFEYLNCHEEINKELENVGQLLALYEDHSTSVQYWSKFNSQLKMIEKIVISASLDFHDRMVEDTSLLDENLDSFSIWKSKFKMRMPPNEDTPRNFELILSSIYNTYYTMESHHYYTSVISLSTALILRLYDFFDRLIEFKKSTSTLKINSGMGLLSTILNSLKKVQGLSKSTLKNETSRTALLSNLMDSFIESKDESKWGRSESGLQLGEVDIKVVNSNQEVICIIEALNINSIEADKIESHYNKIDKYDANGNEFNVLIYFSSISNTAKAWLKLKNFYLDKIDIELIDFDDSKIPNYTAAGKIKIGYTVEHKSSISRKVFHILLKME